MVHGIAVSLSDMIVAVRYKYIQPALPCIYGCVNFYARYGHIIISRQFIFGFTRIETFVELYVIPEYGELVESSYRTGWKILIRALQKTGSIGSATSEHLAIHRFHSSGSEMIQAGASHDMNMVQRNRKEDHVKKR
jgi:hypothetical protein